MKSNNRARHKFAKMNVLICIYLMYPTILIILKNRDNMLQFFKNMYNN